MPSPNQQPGLFGEPVKEPADIRLVRAIVLLKEIVEVEGEDAGVIYKSVESPTTYDATIECQVYKHQYFSELGDALLELYYNLIGEADPNLADSDIIHHIDQE